MRTISVNDLYPRRERSADGWWVCRRCGAKISDGRRYRAWCSAACRRDGLIESGHSGVIQHAVFERDRGVCAACGLDTDVLASTVNAWRWLAFHSRGNPTPRVARDFCGEIVRGLGSMGFDGCDGLAKHCARLPRRLWEADHVVELAAGGTHALENLQTLCTPCHKRKSAAGAARRARERREGGMR